MLRAETYRIPQEREYRRKIRAHPALRYLRRRFPHFWQQAKAQRDSLLQQLRSTALSADALPPSEVFEITAAAFRLFGVRANFEVYLVARPLGAIEGASMMRDNDGTLCLQLEAPVLAQFSLAEIKGLIGHALGHCLLGHDRVEDAQIIRAIAEQGTIEDELGRSPWDDPAVAGLFGLAMVLGQLQELSADRFALLVAHDLQAAVIAQAKSVAGYVGDRYQIGAYCPRLERVSRERDWILRTHPTSANRRRALKLFAESVLYRRALRLPGGRPITEFERVLPQLVPLFDEVDYTPLRRFGSADEMIRERLLELILMDTIAVADVRRAAFAERLIDRYIPPKVCAQALALYDRESGESDEDQNLLEVWLRQAARKDARWKTRMIERLVCLASAGGRVTGAVLEEVADLAVAIDAGRECRRLFSQQFGYVPHRWREASETGEAQFTHGGAS